MMDTISRTFHPEAFAGKRVLVSGGTSGIGLAIAIGFRDLGAEIIASGSSDKKLAELRGNPDLKGIRFEKLDVREKADIDSFIAGLPGLDVLVNCQGIARPVAEFNDETWLDVINVNLNSAMRTSMAAMPLLKQSKGAIINITSMLCYLTDPEVPAYGTSKTGLLGLTRHLSQTFGPDGVRVNAVSPGYIRTFQTEGLWNDPGPTEKVASRSSLKRWGEPEDLVGATLFLASPGAAFITGADLVVDGGFLVGSWR